jgi:hypothetical protein
MDLQALRRNYSLVMELKERRDERARHVMMHCDLNVRVFRDGSCETLFIHCGSFVFELSIFCSGWWDRLLVKFVGTSSQVTHALH